VKNFLDTERKLQWCRLEAEAGVSEIEVTSFVPPKVVPQFQDAMEVAEGALAIGGFTVSALVPNLRGARRGFDLGVPKINYVISASEAHNLANVRRSVDDSLEEFRAIVTERDQVCPDARLTGAISTSFGCSIAGAVDEKDVLTLAVRLVEAGADEVMLCDTVGFAGPAAVRRLFGQALAEVGDTVVAAHFHDTRGLGLANVAAAADVGIRRFDATLGGLGGCPFAPGATGNVNTEDTIYLLEEMGLKTGIKLPALVELHRKVREWLPTERFTSAIERAGLPKTRPDLAAA
jgi:hydroxymethylglutaryl-CoA lyase